LDELFRIAEARKELGYSYEIQVSLMEIYNETIRDLIEPKDEGGEEKKLDVKLSPEGGTHVPGLLVTTVREMEDVIAVLKTGERNRSVGKTNMNEHSSRSHMILSVYTKASNELTGARAFGKLHLIDLAGSERVGRSGAEVSLSTPRPLLHTHDGGSPHTPPPLCSTADRLVG
jgi:kinesin family protein C2/C3